MKSWRELIVSMAHTSTTTQEGCNGAPAEMYTLLDSKVDLLVATIELAISMARKEGYEDGRDSIRDSEF